jgi:hypothetical protein
MPGKESLRPVPGPGAGATVIPGGLCRSLRSGRWLDAGDSPCLDTVGDFRRNLDARASVVDCAPYWVVDMGNCGGDWTMALPADACRRPFSAACRWRSVYRKLACPFAERSRVSECAGSAADRVRSGGLRYQSFRIRVAVVVGSQMGKGEVSLVPRMLKTFLKCLRRFDTLDNCFLATISVPLLQN